MQRTIGIKINKYPELLETIYQYNTIVNQHIVKCLELKTNSKVKLHRALYKIIRIEHPNFPSALIQCARDNAIEMLKSNGYKENTWKRINSSIRFDLRTAKVFLTSGEIQLTTIKGRRKYKSKIPNYFSKYFDWKIKGITLGLYKKFINIKIIVEGVKSIKTDKKDVLGIDLGINNFAVLSNNIFIKPNNIRRVKRKYAFLRRRLQSKGTRSAMRHLKTLSGRERRFMKDFNHCLSKRIADMDYGVFALEYLKGIRKGKKGRIFNRMRSSWAYLQFRRFLIYKAEERGKSTIFIDPKFTSQRCSRCGFIDKNNRNKGRFCCKSCDFEISADLNASINISQIGRVLFEQDAVNHPIVIMNDGVGALHTHSPDIGHKPFKKIEGS